MGSEYEVVCTVGFDQDRNGRRHAESFRAFSDSEARDEANGVVLEIKRKLPSAWGFELWKKIDDAS